MSDDCHAKPMPAIPGCTGGGLLALLARRNFVAFLLALSLAALNGGLALVIAVSAAAWSGAIIVPGILGVLAAVVLANRCDVAVLVRCFKLPEATCLMLAIAALFLRDAGVQYAVLALFVFYAAADVTLAYFVVPQLLGAGEIVAGLAWLLVGMLAGFLAAVPLGGALADQARNGALAVPVAVCVLGAVLSGALALLVPRRPHGAVRQDLTSGATERLPHWPWLTIIGIAAVCLCAALVVALLAMQRQSGLLWVLGLATGVGALWCDRLSGRQIELGLPALAAMGLALLATDLAFVLPSRAWSSDTPFPWRCAIDLAAFGVFFGLCLVQFEARVTACRAPQRGASAAAFAALIKVVAATAAMQLVFFWPQGTPPPALLLVGTLAAAAVAVASYVHEPHLSLRFFTDLLVHAFYRIGKRGFEHIPASGPAVLVCNHVSFVDAVIIMAAVRRPIRFVIDHRIYETPVAHAFFRICRTIPIATAKESVARKEAAFAEVADALRNGELIGLFPEGGITRHGDLNHFRYGVGRIVAETPVPVIPMALRGLWGSFFSRRYGAAMSKPSCLRWLARVELVAGPAVAPRDVTPEDLQQKVGDLRGDWL